VKGENGVPDDARGVAYGSADGGVMKPELGQHLAGSEAEVAEHEVAFDRSRMSGIGRRRISKEREREDGPGNEGMLNRFMHARIL
jgi:hypothetical protein